METFWPSPVGTPDFLHPSLTVASASETAEKGSSDPFMVMKTLFQRGFQASFQRTFSAAKAPPRQAPTLSATAIASSVTWLRVRLAVVIA